MSRQLRIEYPGATYHVINRGLEKRDIYRTDKDREHFLSLLEELHLKYGLLVYGYMLMSNHYHIQLETPNGNLSKIMRQLDGNYSQKFNKRHNRVGPLFQSRYKAVLIDKDSYGLQLLKYIHLNPVKAGMVSKSENYKWSSFPAYIGKVKAPIFLKTDWLLSQFGNSKRKAIKALKDFSMLFEGGKSWMPEKETYKGVILGGSDFISEIQDKYLENREANDEIPKLKIIQKEIDPQQVKDLVAELNLNSKLSKKLIVYGLKKFTKLTLKEITEIFYNSHYSSVTKTYQRLNQQSKKDKNLSNLLLRVDKSCKMLKKV